MTENIKNNKVKPSSYFKYLVIVLMFVQILDTYTTILHGSFPSLIAAEYLSRYPTEVQNSIMAFAEGLVRIGMFFLFFSQYLSDKIGRKKMLAITVFGMGCATLGMFLSVNYFMYMFFVFVLLFLLRV